MLLLLFCYLYTTIKLISVQNNNFCLYHHEICSTKFSFSNSRFPVCDDKWLVNQTMLHLWLVNTELLISWTWVRGPLRVQIYQWRFFVVPVESSYKDLKLIMVCFHPIKQNYYIFKHLFLFDSFWLVKLFFLMNRLAEKQERIPNKRPRLSQDLQELVFK